MTELMTDLHAVALAAGRAAAELIRDRRPAGRVPIAATKASDIDIVTQIDRESEELIRRIVLDARPDDGFVGEEGANVVGSSDVEWVVDPIDGTVNFAYGIDRYAVAIGARVAGTMSVAVVVDVPHDRIWGAIAGTGAWELVGNDRQLLPGPTLTPVSHTLVATGFNYVTEIRERQGRAVAAMVPRVRDIRRFGAAALDLVDVARGIVDLYVEQGLHPWDREPAGLIATESGAALSGLHGPPDGRLVVAAHPEAIGEYLELIEHCGF